MPTIKFHYETAVAGTHLQKHFVKLGSEQPFYIRCQHQISDKILKQMINDYFDGSTTCQLLVH